MSEAHMLNLQEVIMLYNLLDVHVYGKSIEI